MMEKNDRLAAAYLLIGVSAAGRALLAMPDGTQIQELSLTVLAVVGYLLLCRRTVRPLLCGGAAGAGADPLRQPDRRGLDLAAAAAAGGGPVAAVALRFLDAAPGRAACPGHARGGCGAAGRVQRRPLPAVPGGGGLGLLCGIQRDPAVVRGADAPRLQRRAGQAVKDRAARDFFRPARL